LEDEDVKEIELGRGNRMRKETNYDDQLSERDWLKAIGVSFTFLVSSLRFFKGFLPFGLLVYYFRRKYVFFAKLFIIFIIIPIKYYF
jgi:hypothetical protein